MGKRANGEGSIYKYRDRWACSVSLGYDECGKRKRRVIYGDTQKEVNDKLLIIKSEIEQGEYINPSKMTVSEWFNIWLADYCQHIKPRTKEAYKSIIKNYFDKYIGEMPLQKINTHTCQRFMNSIDLSPKTKKNIYGVLNRCLNKATQIQYIKRNPCQFVTIPKIEKKEIRVFSDKEIELIFNELKHSSYYNFYKIALFTGLRRAELLGLTWNCYKPKNGILRVYRQLQLINGEYIMSSPKNGKPRNVTLPPLACDILDSLNDGKSFYIFHDEEGNHLSYYQAHHIFKRAIKKLNLQDGTLHDLRHTYATNALRAGDNIKSVQNNLGHSTPDFTLQVYATVSTDMVKETQTKLQAQFSMLKV